MATDHGAGPGGEDDPRKAFWARALATWGDLGLACEGAYVTPARPRAWRRQDSDFEGVCQDLDRDADFRIIEATGQRALDGDGPALSLCFRAARGFARPAEPDTQGREPDPIPPEVAAAMLDAGLAALGLPPLDIPAPVLKAAQPAHEDSPPALPEPGPPRTS